MQWRPPQSSRHEGGVCGSRAGDPSVGGDEQHPGLSAGAEPDVGAPRAEEMCARGATWSPPAPVVSAAITENHSATGTDAVRVGRVVAENVMVLTGDNRHELDDDVLRCYDGTVGEAHRASVLCQNEAMPRGVVVEGDVRRTVEPHRDRAPHRGAALQRRAETEADVTNTDGVMTVLGRGHQPARARVVVVRLRAPAAPG